MKDWNWASLYWLVWLLGGFGVLETVALLSGHSEWTLSEQVWKLEGLTAKNGSTFWDPLTWNIPHFLIGCFMLWLSIHFIAHSWRQM